MGHFLAREGIFVRVALMGVGSIFSVLQIASREIDYHEMPDRIQEKILLFGQTCLNEFPGKKRIGGEKQIKRPALANLLVELPEAPKVGAIFVPGCDAS